MRLLSFFLCAFMFYACSTSDTAEDTTQNNPQKSFASDSLIEKIITLYDSIDPMNPGDWLLTYPGENVSFEKYIGDNPVKADGERNVIYIKPIGVFDTSKYNVLDMAARFLSVVYHKPVKVLSAVMPDSFPTSAFRKKDGGLQMNTQFVMKKYLRPTLPKDAVVYIALTTVDLYPKDEWNFVFGQSMLQGRVGVWSVNRLCEGPLNGMDTVCLRRTLKIAAHEVGHLFSIKHCKNFHCIMNGSLTLPESDSKPVYFCPNCLQKLCWNNEQHLRDHFFRLMEFWKMLGDVKSEKFYQKNLDLLDKREVQ